MAHLDQNQPAKATPPTSPIPHRQKTDADVHAFLRARLTELHSRLSPQQRRAAEVIQDKSDDVANYSLRHIARWHNIAPSHFSRLARVIGYADYETLREACRSGVRARKLTFAQKAAALRNKNISGESGSFVVRYGIESMDNIQVMLNEIAPTLVDAIADQLASARRVFLAGGLGSSHLMAHMKYMADIPFDNWQIIGANAVGVLTKLSADDTVLMLGYAPYARDSVHIARMVKNTEANFVVITDEYDSPLAGLARHVICLPTDSTQFFPSYVSALVFLETLIAMVVCRSPATAHRSTEAVKETISTPANIEPSGHSSTQHPFTQHPYHEEDYHV